MEKITVNIDVNPSETVVGDVAALVDDLHALMMEFVIHLGFWTYGELPDTTGSSIAEAIGTIVIGLEQAVKDGLYSVEEEEAA